ncbi:hypothetical protein TrVE_jg2471 [Triparma verrucosa]|uniref:Uncharacterized protein n=1 Tax=Triparma verrucosa TaxID=1606542 RepID=A0A9W7KXM9_9STRA|nr:hypothetical protein TrVE_jg2471 [Triparma verrucosa]
MNPPPMTLSSLCLTSSSCDLQPLQPLDSLPLDSLPLDSLSSSTLLSVTGVDSIQTTQTFEAQLPPEVAVSTLFIFVVFATLRFRINNVTEKAKQLAVANEKLREARVTVMAGRQKDFDQELLEVMQAESALEDARTVIKDVVTLPNPNQNVNNPNNPANSNNSPAPTLDSNTKVTNPFVLGVLSLVGASLLATIFMLSFDPMAAPQSQFAVSDPMNVINQSINN